MEKVIKVNIIDIEYSGDFTDEYLPREIEGVVLTIKKDYKPEEEDDIVCGLINDYLSETISVPVDSFGWEVCE